MIDDNRTSVNESYELYWQDQRENYGIGFGIEEERGEAVKTWLLPPGVYTVLSVAKTYRQRANSACASSRESSYSATSSSTPARSALSASTRPPYRACSGRALLKLENFAAAERLYPVYHLAKYNGQRPVYLFAFSSGIWPHWP